MRDVVISSGAVNRYGYRIKPEGIITDSYEKNPVLMVQHDGRILSIGKINNLRLENGMKVGTPEFDEGDPLAMDVKRKWEKGYLSAVSIDHMPITTTEDPAELLPGQTRCTVSATDLLEVSIVNVPGDRGAVALSNTDKNIDQLIPLLKLSNQSQSKNIPVMNDKIAKSLGLAADASEDAILQGINQLNARATAAESARIDSLVSFGKEAGAINEDNEQPIRKLAALDYENAHKLVQLSVKKLKDGDDAKPIPTTLTTVKAAIDSVKDQKIATTPGDETFEKLSKENPKLLNQIRKEDPARYAKLAEGYAAVGN